MILAIFLNINEKKLFQIQSMYEEQCPSDANSKETTFIINDDRSVVISSHFSEEDHQMLNEVYELNDGIFEWDLFLGDVYLDNEKDEGKETAIEDYVQKIILYTDSLKELIKWVYNEEKKTHRITHAENLTK